MTKSISRRSALIQGTAATLTGAAALSKAGAAPLLLPSTHKADGNPNDAIRIGCIGVGRMGLGDMRGLLARGLEDNINARIVAVCDPDGRRAEAAKADVEKRYADKLNGAKPEVDVYSGFRKLLERDDIDAVSISTPDFWHAGHGVAAAQAKKDIYIQKPLTLTIDEGKHLVKAVRDNGVILQVGSQQRSDSNFRRACELVRNGRVGKLRQVEVWLPPDHGHADQTDTPVPEWMDYDMWMGPTAERPYAEKGVHPIKGYSRPGWLQRRGYTLGMITGWGSHMNDIAQWARGNDHDSGLVEVHAKAHFPQRGLWDVHTSYFARGKWADGVPLIQRTDPQAGVTFHGSDGWLFVRRGGIAAGPSSILKEEIGEDETKLYVSSNHYRNFLECVRSREEPICPVEVGHRSNTVCIITHISMLLDRKLKWDPKTEMFVGDDEANAMLAEERRDPWKF